MATFFESGNFGYVLIAAASYAVGCFLGAYYIVRWQVGQDLRSVGSQNAGATNAWRVVGRWGGISALVVDAGKGLVVLLLARLASPDPLVAALAMVAVAAGHVWPVQLRFRGGKGAATAFGMIVVFDSTVVPMLAAIGLILWMTTRSWRKGGVAALAAAPIVSLLAGHDPIEVAGLTGVVAIVAFAHWRPSRGRRKARV